MAQSEAETPAGPDRRPLVAVLLGLFVVFLPLFLVPSAEDAGSSAVVVGLAQAIAAAVGLAVAGAGLYSYRTGDRRPAVAASATVIGLFVVGAVGAIVELTGGPLVPIWAWFLAAVAVILGAFALTHRHVDPGGGDARSGEG